jgi:chromosome segregation ATPase
MSDEMLKIYEELLRQINRVYDSYVEQVKRLNNMWSDYKSAVSNVKRNWDADNVLLMLRINELRASIDSIREELDMLKVRKELGLIDDEEYSKTSTELTDTLTKLSNMYEEARSKVDEIDKGIKEHWFRSMDVTTLTTDQVDGMIKELEENKAKGEVPEDVYTRIKSDLELIKRVVQALALIKTESKA